MPPSGPKKGKAPEAYLYDILRAGKLARSFIEGISRVEFQQDEKTKSAVVNQLTVIGEATKCLSHLSPSFCSKHTAIPWKQWAGIRDKLVHSYHSIDHEITWATLKEDLPVLIEYLESEMGLSYDPNS